LVNVLVSYSCRGWFLRRKRKKDIRSSPFPNHGGGADSFKALGMKQRITDLVNEEEEVAFNDMFNGHSDELIRFIYGLVDSEEDAK
jgi:hypothetical protein